MQDKIMPGHPYPLGASWDGKGVNFAIYSETAEKVELCLFDNQGAKAQQKCIPLGEVTGHVWHGYLR